MFERPFAELDNVAQTRVYLEVVESTGRARPSATRFAARAGAAGRAVFLIGIGVVAYNIANAEDRVWQTGREASSIAGGLGGSIAAGALAGVWLGPLGVAIGAFVGGVAGVLLADQAYVATVGASDRQAGVFIARFANFLETDEEALANALYTEVGMDGDRAHAIFLAMDESYNTDADDVAALYLRSVFAGGGATLQALRLNRAFCDTLIRILNEGWTSSEEASLIARLRIVLKPECRRCRLQGSSDPALPVYRYDAGRDPIADVRRFWWAPQLPSFVQLSHCVCEVLTRLQANKETDFCFWLALSKANLRVAPASHVSVSWSELLPAPWTPG